MDELINAVYAGPFNLQPFSGVILLKCCSCSLSYDIRISGLLESKIHVTQSEVPCLIKNCSKLMVKVIHPIMPSCGKYYMKVIFLTWIYEMIV